MEGGSYEINTCIACNQACLDYIFTDRVATCLVNPRAGREVEFHDGPARSPRRLAVVGAGPAGMAFALEAARRGHRVTLLESQPALGGQLNLAKQVPGKHEFHEMLRYFQVSLERAGVEVRLGIRATAQLLAGGEFDDIVLATGVVPRTPRIPGIDHPMVLGYAELLAGEVEAGERVAIIGAGGIGFDVAEFLVGQPKEATDPAAFADAWGVDPTIAVPGGLRHPARPTPRRQVHMLQRKPGSLGRNLGKSTGWILKAKLRQANVSMTPGVTYDAIDHRGLHYTVDGERRLLQVDNVIVCAGQEPNRALFEALRSHGLRSHLIGGADVAVELDALRAIDQATRLAVSL